MVVDPAEQPFVGACRKLWRRAQDRLRRPQFHTLLTSERPKQTASSRFCSHTVQRLAKPKPLIAVGMPITERPPQSGRIEARTGLRMMPTFPRSPRSFRTAGVPQDGWKAGLSGAVFPDRQRLKPAPGMRLLTAGLPSPFVH